MTLDTTATSLRLYFRELSGVTCPPCTMSSTTMAKKNKAKKVADPNETSKLLAAKISQLEQDAAGEKDQEQEVGA